MKLLPYQERGVEYLVPRERAYLGDAMGLGKTVQAAAAAARLGVGRTLVVTRAAVRENWHREWMLWGSGSLTVISYADPSLHDGRVNGADYDLVVLDEAHAVKNASAKRTRAALRAAKRSGRSWLLSGTPMPNYDPMELWPPIAALWPELALGLGISTEEQWRRHFCHSRLTRYGLKTYAIRNAPDLRRILDTMMLRRTVEDVYADLPPLRIDVQLLPRDSKMERVIGAIRKRDEDDEWYAVYRRVTGVHKAPRVAEQLRRELSDGEYRKIVVMAQHLAVLDRLEKDLGQFGLVRLDGSTRDRQALVDRFVGDDGTRVFLGQQSAAGEGLNLQVAREVVLVEPSNSPAENAQAIARIRPHLQNNRCRVRLFAVAGSVDEGIIDNIARKLRHRKELGL